MPVACCSMFFMLFVLKPHPNRLCCRNPDGTQFFEECASSTSGRNSTVFLACFHNINSKDIKKTKWKCKKIGNCLSSENCKPCKALQKGCNSGDIRFTDPALKRRAKLHIPCLFPIPVEFSFIDRCIFSSCCEKQPWLLCTTGRLMVGSWLDDVVCFPFTLIG